MAVVSTGGPGQKCQNIPAKVTAHLGISEAAQPQDLRALGRELPSGQMPGVGGGGGCLSPAHLPRDSSSDSRKVFLENTWSGFAMSTCSKPSHKETHCKELWKCFWSQACRTCRLWAQDRAL